MVLSLFVLAACSGKPRWPSDPTEQYACTRLDEARKECLQTYARRDGFRPEKAPRELDCPSQPKETGARARYLRCVAETWEDADCTDRSSYKGINDRILNVCQPMLHKARIDEVN